MEWQRRVLGSLVIVAALLASPAAAAAQEAAPEAAPAAEPVAEPEESEFARRGPYAGLGLIYAPGVFKLRNAEDMAGGITLEDTDTFGLDARAGYRLNPRFAVEGDYQFLPGFEVERGGGGTLAELTTHTLTVNGKLYAMVDTFQPYFVGGAGLLHVNADATLPGFSGDGTGFAGRVGVGADYYLRPDVVLNLEFTVILATGPVTDVRFLPLVFGAQYRF